MGKSFEFRQAELCDSKRLLDFAKDPLYSYVCFTRPDGIAARSAKEVTEKDLINDPWVQRLRRLRQNQQACLVYPALTHTRFEHSLGVMHLAGEFARHLYVRLISSLERDRILPREDQQGLLDTLPSAELVEECFRIAGLFHDIGHGPLSHTFEVALKKYYAKTGYADATPVGHELVGQLVVKRCLASLLPRIRRSPTGPFRKNEKLDPYMIEWLIHPRPGPRFDHFYRQARFFWVRTLRDILTGFYNVDTLDYLLRDAHHGGNPEFGTVDVERLIRTSFLTLDKLFLHRSSVSALVRMLQARAHSYQNVFFHKTTRAFELASVDLLVEFLKSIGFHHPSAGEDRFLKSFFGLDDYLLASLGNPLSALSTNQRDRWRRLANRTKVWNVVFEGEYQIPASKVHEKVNNDGIQARCREILLASARELRRFTPKALQSKFGLTKRQAERLRQMSAPRLVSLARLDFPSIDAWHARPDEIRIGIYNPLTENLTNRYLANILEKLPIEMVFFRVFAGAQDESIVKALAAHKSDEFTTLFYGDASMSMY